LRKGLERVTVGMEERRGLPKGLDSALVAGEAAGGAGSASSEYGGCIDEGARGVRLLSELAVREVKRAPLTKGVRLWMGGC
jgi:hypothetical protein